MHGAVIGAGQEFPLPHVASSAYFLESVRPERINENLPYKAISDGPPLTTTTPSILSQITAAVPRREKVANQFAGCDLAAPCFCWAIQAETR